MMKKYFIFLIFLTALISCNSNNSKNNPTIVEDKELKIIPFTENGLKKLLQEINKKEPSAKAIFFDRKKVELYIAVYDDGTSRKGLAEYYCQLCKNFDVAVNTIYIMQYKSRKINPDFDKILGKSNCKF